MTARFDDTHTTITITLPVLTAAADFDRQLEETMASTLEHLGFLHYQLFLNRLQAYWPAQVAYVTARHDGEGYVLLGMDLLKDADLDFPPNSPMPVPDSHR